MRLRISLLMLAFVLVAGACGESGVTFNPDEVTIETSVSSNLINAGATFSVSCQVLDLDGREVKTDTAFTVVPGKAVKVNGSDVIASLPGSYEVTCMLPEADQPEDKALWVKDETPEIVLVTKKNISAIETVLDSNEAIAGTEVTAECTVLNLSGEEVTWETELVVRHAPPEGAEEGALGEMAFAEEVEITGHTIRPLVLGDYTVACKAVDLPIEDTTPEPLNVIAGDAAVVRATIKEDEVTAGTEVPVFCTVEDEFGNVLEVDNQVDPQAGIQVDGTIIIPTIAGEYDVTCSAVDVPELAQIPDHLIVTAGPIASVVLTAKPNKNAYKIDDKVEVTGSAGDEYGNPIEGLSVSIVAPEGMEAAGDKHKFIEEGVFTFVGTLEAPYEDISGELTLICDESGPDILLFTPERAVTLTGDTMVDVEGNVLDKLSSSIELEINGISVPVDSEGNFFHVVEGAHGMNILSVVAYDGYGNSAKIVQSFYHSSDYVNYDTGQIDDVMLEQALLVFLGQNFLDDGVHDKAEIDDIATLVEILLDSISMDMLGSDLPVVDTVMEDLVSIDLLNVAGFEFTLSGDLDLTVYIQEVSFAQPYVAINTRDGGIDMTISFMGTPDDPGIYVQLYVEIGFTLMVHSTLGGNDLFSAGISPGVAVQSSAGIESLLVETSFDINKNAGEELDIKVLDLNVVPAGISIELMQDLKIDLGPVIFNGQDVFVLPVVELGDLVQGIDDILSNYIIDPVLNFVIPGALDLLEPLIEDQVTNLLGNLLNQFEFELPIPIPQLPGGDAPVELAFKTKLSSVHFTVDGGELGLATGFMADKGVDRDVLGSMLRMGCGSGAFGTPEFDSAEKVEIGAKQDMVNELLFSLWWAGGLSLSLDESVLGEIPQLQDFGLSDLAVGMDFWLPPILDDCTSKGMVEIQLGDMLVKPSFSLMGAPLNLSMFVSAALDATIYGDGNNIGVEIMGITDIGTQIVEIDGDLGPLAGMFDIEELVEKIIVPMIVEQVSNLSLGSFPLPEIDLSTLIPGIPPGTSLSLGNLVIDMTKGYLLFGGELM